ncbi:helix-turn-helix transcriptional regulator [Actinoplanes sp. L3-i22]|uniref:helix-turn-helix transcriptional regulator n=1 Tax=Actinoplanes sp. L3-i22 TaxID=2836373 RepID=UPI001C85CCC9|nr:helix-turn-helix transcriptional regulator [Actinoplanes sp. L3-i22]
MEILEHLSTVARGATGHAAAAAALELAAEVAQDGRRRLLTLAAADAQLAGEPGRAADLLRRAAATGEPLRAPLVGDAVADARREMARGRYRAAERGLAAIAGRFWATGAIRRLPSVLSMRSWALARAGDLAGAAADAEQALTLAPLYGDEQAVARARHTRTLLNVLSGHAGADVVPSPSDPVGIGLALLAGLAHRRPDASEEAAPAAEFLPDLLECRLIRNRALSPRDLSTLHGMTRSSTAPIAANAWRVLGLTSPNGAGDCFARATRLHDAMDLPFDNARVHLSHGERLRRDGDRRAARNQLRLARDTFQDLDATPWLQRAERELNGTAETLSRPGLTPAELEVARIVATGVSTRETAEQLFLSPKTVEFHLSKVYRKLGVANRAQLAHVFPVLSYA